MKQENASAGQELEKIVKHIKEILQKSFGEAQQQAEFDPLDLQKDIQVKKKADGLNFLSKQKPKTEGPEDLLDLGIGEAHNKTEKTASEPQKTSKANGLNFLPKKTPPTNRPAEQSANLLDLDLLGEPTQKTPSTSAVNGSTHGGISNMDLFDLGVGSPIQNNGGGSTQPPIQNNKSQNYGDLLDLGGFGDANQTTQGNSKPKAATKKEDLFDFGL